MFGLTPIAGTDVSGTPPAQTVWYAGGANGGAFGGGGTAWTIDHFPIEWRFVSGGAVASGHVIEYPRWSVAAGTLSGDKGVVSGGKAFFAPRFLTTGGAFGGGAAKYTQPAPGVGGSEAGGEATFVYLMGMRNTYGGCIVGAHALFGRKLHANAELLQTERLQKRITGTETTKSFKMVEV